MSAPDELLDIAQAAAFLNVSETSLRRWTNAGLLPHLRVGGRRERRFRHADLVAFLEHHSGELHPTPAPHGSAKAQLVIDGWTLTLGTHLCGLYSTDLGRLRLAARFLIGGLRPETACLLVGPKRIRDAITARLAEAQSDLKEHVRRGRLSYADHAKTPAVQLERFDALVRGAVGSGAGSVRIVADATDFVGKLDTGHAEFEAALDRFIARQFPVVILCLHDVRRLSGERVLDALKTHPDNFRTPTDRWLA
jgi:excisionase family DNA binding protein